MSDDFMQMALDEAHIAAQAGEVPVGAVLVGQDGNILARTRNQMRALNDPTAHAEMEAIRDAANWLNRRNLSGHVMYSSSRPCPMCEAAAYWANLSAMFYGNKGAEAGSPKLCG